ncbi:hypothetical protein E2C01_085944 [Portunus trituberculatus]|uniref:Uncharacterized protein n=1 Tax=Portunus trituberculatus TaxID=210409 RepID=A0A5B7J2F0_PORTR|nr:hypothetical protein [Portunus trituberculatus]
MVGREEKGYSGKVTKGEDLKEDKTETLSCTVPSEPLLSVQTPMKRPNCIICVPSSWARHKESPTFHLNSDETKNKLPSPPPPCVWDSDVHTAPPRTRPHKTPQDGRPHPAPPAGHMLASQAY